MRTINVNSKTITIGRQMEDNATQVIFDLTPYIELWGDGEVELVHTRHDDSGPYAVENVERVDDTLVWTVSDTDTAFRGDGRAEIRWIVGDTDTLGKSIIYTTKVLKSETGDITIPSALQSWYDAMIAYIDAHSGGSSTAVTYTLTIDGRTITLTGSDSSTVSVTVPDTDLSGYMTADDIATAISNAVGAIVVPTKVSDLENDSGFVTDAGVTSFNGETGAITYTAPVTAVNGSTGAVTIPTATTETNGLMTTEQVTQLDACYTDYTAMLALI